MRAENWLNNKQQNFSAVIMCFELVKYGGIFEWQDIDIIPVFGDRYSYRHRTGHATRYVTARQLPVVRKNSNDEHGDVVAHWAMGFGCLSCELYRQQWLEEEITRQKRSYCGEKVML